MKHFSFICRLHVIIFIMVLMVTGCTLDRQGLQPALYCGITGIQYDVGPCSDAYRFTGVCDIEGETATYEVGAVWSATDGKSAAIIKANYQGNNLSESIVATCPGGDPIINDNISCTNKAVNGNLFSTIPWSYEVYQNSNFIPDFLGAEIKGIIQAQAQWPETPPVIQSPKQHVRYKCGTPCKVKLFTSMRLPFEKGNISGWKIQFYYRKWDQVSQAWSGYTYGSIDKLLQTSTGEWQGYTFLDITDGKYQINGAMETYTNGNCKWDTGWQDNPVEFYVGPIKMFPGAKAPVTAKAQDYAIRSFESKVVLPGQRSLTGEVVDKESFSFRWQVKNTGEKQSRQTTLLVKCEAVSDVPCPAEFPFSRTIGPIDPEASGEYVGITVLAPASGAKYRFLAVVNPDNAVAETNKDSNSLYSQFAYSQPKVISDEELLKQATKRFEALKGKVKATSVKKTSLAQVILPKKNFKRNEKIILKTIVPAAQKETVEIERQEGSLWVKSKEPVIRTDKSTEASSFRLIRHDVSVKQSGTLRARAKVAGGPWSNWAYFKVE